ncbi:uncharacterized protein EI90DRAFT_2654733 [Cantharellus anzutake]|uniref:uncharacterized protein n=1 Tax=Cantharellus anzutake TaxID=1750568 RepID=UPI001907E6F7|nr:uncharacterized protein EI90DRAFT_2654733 [Cantharellus anzutake]KAF8337461.1 hypothetical protein EI90DRAFT_2654733 [Cantharellus anzutake]
MVQLPITMQLRNQSTSTGDTVLYTWTVSTNPISVLIWQPEYIYETLYFVGVDRDGGRGETPAYVVQPGQIVGDWLSVSTPALSRVSLISKSIASISSKFGSSLATSSGTVTTAATSRSTSYLPSNTSSPATSVPTSSTSPLGGGGSNHTAIIASSAIIGVVALVAFIALGYWKWKRRCPPPYTSSGGVKYTQPNSTGTLQCFQP